MGRNKVLGLPYVPIDPQIEDSDKMDHFLEILDLHDDDFAPFMVIKLIKWAGLNRPDGHLGEVTPRKLSKITLWKHWDRPAEELVDALLESQWIVKDAERGGYCIPTWDRYGGRVLAERNKWAEDKRRQRAEAKARREAAKNPPAEPAELPDPVPVDCPRGHPEDVPGRPSGVHPLKSEECSVKCEGGSDQISAKAPKCIFGEPQTLGFGALEEACVGRFGRGIDGTWIPTAEQLAPFSTREITQAVKQAWDEDRRNAGTVIRIIERWRREGARKPATRATPRSGRGSWVDATLEFAAEDDDEGAGVRACG